MRFSIIRPLAATALAVALFALSIAGAQPNYWIAGIWDTSEGEMKIEHSDPEVTGIYSQDGGRIFGTLAGHVLTGVWVERSSGVKCETPRDGSYHWGRISFTFNDGFDAFAGKWGYCDQAVTRNWTGTLKAAAKLIR